MGWVSVLMVAFVVGVGFPFLYYVLLRRLVLELIQYRRESMQQRLVLDRVRDSLCELYTDYEMGLRMGDGSVPVLDPVVVRSIGPHLCRVLRSLGVPDPDLDRVRESAESVSEGRRSHGNT